MEARKIISTTVMSFAIATMSFAQQPVEKTLVKSFNLQGNDVIELQLDGNIEVKEWNSSTMRVEMLISIEKGNETMLKSLIKAGRYNLVSKEKVDAFLVSMPGIERALTIKGQPLLDGVNYVISIPSGVTIRNGDLASTELKE